MSTHSYISTQPVLIILLSTYSLWFSFFLVNKSSSINKSIPTQSILVKNTLPEGAYNKFIMSRFSIVLLSNVFLITVLMRSVSSTLLYNQLELTHLNYSIILITLAVYILLMWSLNSLLLNNRGITSDYLFTLANLFVFAPLIYLSSNLFSFFFLLEVLSVLVFLKFTSLQMVKPFNGANNTNKVTKVVNPMPEKHVIALFTQYWISFFSSILFVFFILISLFLCNTTTYIELDNLLPHTLGGKGTSSSLFLLI